MIVKGNINIYGFVLHLVLLLMLTGCSDTFKPTNIEPKLMLLEATEISRNEALVAVEIEWQDNKNIDFVRFRYGTDSSMSSSSRELEVSSNRVELKLAGLETGQTYWFCAEGGMDDSMVHSQTMTFSTESNAKPVVGEVKSLTQGPTGIIVVFEILDNGGEKVVSTGCDVVESTTGNMSRFYAEDFCENEIRLHISNLKRMTEYRIRPFAENGIGETVGPEYVFKTDNAVVIGLAGTLSTVLDEYEEVLNPLKISGEMNGDDFRFLRGLAGASDLTGENKAEGLINMVDLADVRIVVGGGSYDGSRFTEADKITKGLFSNCQTLRSIILPMTATTIEKDAFKDCTALETLEIPISIVKLSPSSGCTSLSEITVSAGNQNYKSQSGVLFNSQMTDLVWFPTGKTGSFEFPEIIQSINEYAFRDAAISSLKLPGDLTTLGIGAFAGSNIEEMTLPDGLTNIPTALFQNCRRLKVVRLGAGTNYIGDYAFDGVPLEHLFLPKTPPVVSGYGLSSLNTDLFKTCTLHVPAGSKTIYTNHQKWRLFTHIVEF